MILRQSEISLKVSLHHPHLFASNMDEAIKFYRDMFGAEILFDLEMAGARNVMIAIGSGKINFYDQPPKNSGRGLVHHLGMETDNLEALVEHMKRIGFTFKKEIKNFGVWKYVMVEGPDHVLIELFEIDKAKLSSDQFEKISSL
ncbi:MAG: VOC family protein [Promethearchaeota archaeon]|nr:MAG: VOC family protein [Candidatus Lokiarchaeota archaeon]